MAGKLVSQFESDQNSPDFYRKSQPARDMELNTDTEGDV